MIHKYPKSIDSQPIVKGRNLEANLIPLKTSSSIPSTPMYFPGSKRLGSSTSTQAIRKRTSPLASREKLLGTKKFEFDNAPANIWPFNNPNDVTDKGPDEQKDFANLEYLISEEGEVSKNQENIAHLTRDGTEKSFKEKTSKKFFPKLQDIDNYEENFFKLPDEFKSQTIFRLLYSRKGDKQYMKLNPVSPQHNKNSSAKLAPLQTTQEEVNYYHLETAGYKNYKYPCIENYLQKPKKKFNKGDKRNTIESTITHLHTVQQVISSKKKQLLETLEQRTLQERSSSKQTMSRHNKNTYSTDKIRGPEIRVTNGNFRPFSTSTGFKSPNMNSKGDEIRPSTHSMYFRKTFIPNFKSIINDKKASFKEKQIKQEYDFYVQMSKKYLEEKKQQLQKSAITDEEKTVQKFQLETIEKEKGIVLKIFIETQEVFKKHPKYVTDRILLALNLHPNVPFSIVNFEEFKEFKEILCFKETEIDKMVSFVVKFFKIDEDNLTKQDFFRILRTVTDRIDSRLMMQPEKANLFENFIENFELTGILKKNTNDVDFERFKYIYSTHKMNIRDMIDLISGVV